MNKVAVVATVVAMSAGAVLGGAPAHVRPD